MRATEHAARGPGRLLERRHGLAEIVARGNGVFVERPPVNQAHPATYVSTVRHLPPGKLPAGPEKQSREQLDAVEAAYAALDAAAHGDEALAAEIVSVGVFEASQRRRAALLARNVTKA